MEIQQVLHISECEIVNHYIMWNIITLCQEFAVIDRIQQHWHYSILSVILLLFVWSKPNMYVKYLDNFVHNNFWIEQAKMPYSALDSMHAHFLRGGG